MAFPTTSVLEAFTGTGALSANWTAPAYAGDSTPERFSDVCTAPASVYGSAYWDAATYGPDAEVFCTSPAAATGQSQIVLWCKIKDPGGANSCNYAGIFDFGAETVAVYRQYTGADNLLSTPSLTLSVGDKIGLCGKTSGADLLVEVWSDSGSGWTLRSTITDTGAVATYPDLASAGGWIGFALYGDGLTTVTRSIDDFGGGTVAAAADTGLAWIRA